LAKSLELSTLNKQYKKYLKTIKKWRTPSNLNKKQDIAITRIRIGHNFLTHYYLISKENQPMCDTCIKALTVKNILLRRVQNTTLYV